MGCRPIVIPNAIYGKIGKRATLEDRILLSAWRLTAFKGYDLLLEAFSQVADKHPDWKLCICGDGEERGTLAQLAYTLNIQDQLILPGFVDVSEFMSRAGAYVLSSRSEGFPLVLVEAMAHGLPVVAYALPPVLEICSEGALLDSCGNVEALAACIDQLLTSASLRRELGDHSYNRAQQYAIPVVARC